ncbi:tyrosine-type recombinase/integrase [Streptosporangium canum]|uniref:tyrosine-type recombinase/integrase n=1 Tax=Streptosporangium canum TaxID=324952 RepID=UPI0036AB4533
MPLAVQRLRSPDGGPVSYTVVGPNGLAVEPIEDFLAHLWATGLSPNTVQAYAHDLKDLFTWLDQVGLDFRRLGLEQLAQFFDWLRRPRASRAPGVFMLPGMTPAVENSTLQRKRGAIASFYRFHARRDESVPALLGELIGVRPTGRYIPLLAHTQRGRPGAESYSPIRIHVNRKPPKTLTPQEIDQILAACRRRRDRFLFALLDESGLRIGEALGLRHSDLHLRRGQVHVVPREDNANGARTKGMKGRIVPVRGELFELYADYMEIEYGSLDSDYIFINLFHPPIGAPMTRQNVNDLVERLRRRTEIMHFHPHALRHTYATRLLRAEVPIEVVAELLGHASSQTTAEIYGHLKVEDHRRALVVAGVLEDEIADGVITE